jgi:hypothetical protein
MKQKAGDFFEASFDTHLSKKQERVTRIRAFPARGSGLHGGGEDGGQGLLCFNEVD